MLSKKQKQLAVESLWNLEREFVDYSNNLQAIKSTWIDERRFSILCSQVKNLSQRMNTIVSILEIESIIPNKESSNSEITEQ